MLYVIYTSIKLENFFPERQRKDCWIVLFCKLAVEKEVHFYFVYILHASEMHSLDDCFSDSISGI